MLASTTWGAGAKLVVHQPGRSATLWLSSVLQLGGTLHMPISSTYTYNTMRTITGAVRCTRTDWLPVLSSIAPVDIRREVATSRMILRARAKPELPLLTDIDFHPRPRLKLRRSIWSNLPDEALTIHYKIRLFALTCLKCL